MSILVKGMDMPTNCFLCPLSVLNENRLFCEVTKNEALRAKIDAECPLVPVPPHGDLIDRDAYQYSGDLMDEPVIIPAEEGYECPY